MRRSDLQHPQDMIALLHCGGSCTSTAAAAAQQQPSHISTLLLTPGWVAQAEIAALKAEVAGLKQAGAAVAAASSSNRIVVVGGGRMVRPDARTRRMRVRSLGSGT